MVATAPYPFARWARIDRAEVSARRRVARSLPTGRFGELAKQLGELVGAPVELRAGPLYVCAPGQLGAAVADPLVALVFRSPTPGEHVVLELAPDLALVFVDRVLGGDGRQVGAPLTTLSELEAGVLAYVGARMLTLAEGPWTLGGVLRSRDALVLAVGDEGSLVWTGEVLVLHDGTRDGIEMRGAARLWLPEGVRWQAQESALVFPQLPLTMVLDGGEVTLSADALATLAPGDVVILDEAWWGRKPTLRARVLGGRRSEWWCVAGPEGIVQGERRIHGDAAVAEGRRMTMTKDDGTQTMAAVGDAPVEISVELVRFRVSLDELARTRPGEVLLSGRPIGKRVSLRVGDAVVGEGELVDVEGEVGVRVLSIGA